VAETASGLSMEEKDYIKGLKADFISKLQLIITKISESEQSFPITVRQAMEY
jgi:hypothetical protein